MTDSCEKDFDCPSNQYCYDSQNCVNFTQCRLFNRKEAALPARNGFQCGPCLDGFGNKEDPSEVYCLEQDPVFNISMLYIIIPIFVILIIIFACAYICVKKTRCLHFINSLNKKYTEIGEQTVAFDQGDENAFQPSAPSEHDAHNQTVGRKKTFCLPFYNNGEARENNKSQNATPYHAPSWIGNASFSDDIDDNHSTQSFAQNNTAFQACHLPVAGTSSDTNNELAIQIPEQTVEHEDNARNNALIQIDSSFSDDNADNTTTFGSDKNDNGNNEDSATIKTVVVNQNIRMTLNVSN